MRKTFYSFIVIILLFSIVPVFGAGSEGKKSLTFGKQQFNAKNYEKAKELFVSAINSDPSLLDAYEYRAKCSAELGEDSIKADLSFYKAKLMTLGDLKYTGYFGIACTYLYNLEKDPKGKEDAAEKLNKVIELDKDGPFGTRAAELQKEYSLSSEKATPTEIPPADTGTTEEKPDKNTAPVGSGFLNKYGLYLYLLIPGIAFFALLLTLFAILFSRKRLKSTFATVIAVACLYILATIATVAGIQINTKGGNMIAPVSTSRSIFSSAVNSYSSGVYSSGGSYSSGSYSGGSYSGGGYSGGGFSGGK